MINENQKVEKGEYNPGVEQGKRRRIPHVVNCLHGAVGYNVRFIIFNNLKEGIRFLTDPDFNASIKKFSKYEQREIMILFRERNYDEVEYAYTLGVIRSVLPCYANANGPKKKILWGSVLPFPTVNVINGSYLSDISALEKHVHSYAARPAINENFFSPADNYSKGLKDEPGYFEKAFAWANYKNILKEVFKPT